MGVVLINPFTVFAGKEAVFLQLWDATEAIFANCDGYGGARLVKAHDQQVRGQRPPFTHVNIAEWDSELAYGKALGHPDLATFLPRYKAVCTFQPALYTRVRDKSISR